MTALGMRLTGGVPNGVWTGFAKEKMAKARKCRLSRSTLVSETKLGGRLRSDEAYMRGVADKGQEGRWAQIVPTLGTWVKFCRYRLGFHQDAGVGAGGDRRQPQGGS